ncbi:MAG: hypothetical protein LBC73_05990 [Oscillospiraceae bacterium]|jgi:hypothetical protein|nr:hypothetical protein [Oscillospiraceae bacterium]
MKIFRTIIASFFAILLFITVCLPTALAMPAFAHLRTTPVSGAGIVREAFFEAKNTSEFTYVAGVQLMRFDNNQPAWYPPTSTIINEVNIPPRTTWIIYSARLTSNASTQEFRDHGGRR